MRLTKKQKAIIINNVFRQSKNYINAQSGGPCDSSMFMRELIVKNILLRDLGYMTGKDGDVVKFKAAKL